MIQDFDSKWRKIPNKRIRESEKVKIMLDCATWFNRRKLDLIVTYWRRWLKEVSIRIYVLRIEFFRSETEIMRGTPWSRIKGQKQRGQRTLGDCFVTMSVSVQKLTQESFAEFFHATEWEECVASLHSLKNGILYNACSSSPKMDAYLEMSALTHTIRLTHSPAKILKRMVTKMQWFFLVDARQLGCVFSEKEQPKSSSILAEKLEKILKQIGCVQLTKVVARHANIREPNPSLGMICPGDPHQHNPNSPKFDDPSQKETECLKLKENKAAFFSLSENWCLPAPWNQKLWSTPARRCTWSAKRTWVMMKWTLWRNCAVLR